MDQSHSAMKSDIKSNSVNQNHSASSIDRPTEDELSSQSSEDTDAIPLEARAIDLPILRYICAMYGPFSLVKSEGLKNFIHDIKPSYTIPNSQTLSKILPSYYEECVKKVKDQLQQAKAVFLLGEGWKIDGEDPEIKVYAVSAHYITENTKFCSSFLECIKCYNESYEEVVDWLNSLATNFNIESKICGVVTDEQVLRGAVTCLGWQWLPCFAHSLDSIVRGSISHLQVIIGKVRTVVREFKVNSKALKELYKQQQANNIPKLKLKLDISTQWKSTFVMLRRVLMVKDAFLTAAYVLGIDCSVTTEEWEIIASVTKSLEIFDKVTSEMSSEPTVSLSKVFVMSSIMLKHIQSLFSEGSPHMVVVEMLRKLLLDLSNMFADTGVSELIFQCVLLDPRFKKWAFGKAEHANMYKYFADELGSNVFESPELDMEIDDIPKSQGSHTEKSLWEDFDEEVAKAKPAPLITEICMYVGEPIVSRDESPLLWWESRKARYPNLYQIVLGKLCIQANSIPCHTLFTEHGRYSVEKRNRARVSCRTLNKMLFINMNAKKEEGDMEIPVKNFEV